MDHKMISLADQVFDEIERKILSGYYKRGEFLTESRLSDELGVSRTPIREAFFRLNQEHLLEISPKGALVLGTTLRDIRDIYEIRLRIEGLASRLAAENITDEGVAELRKVLELQEFFTIKGDSDGIKDMDDQFHRTIYGLCSSPILRYTLEPLHRRIVKYRKASISAKSRAQDSLKEHQLIFDAIRAHRAEDADALTVSHVQNAMNNILHSAQNLEDPGSAPPREF